MHLRPPLHWWMYPNLNLHMATSIWLMQDSGIYCCGSAPRVAGRLLSLWSLWDFCLPSLWLLLLGSLRGNLSIHGKKGLNLSMKWRDWTAAVAAFNSLPCWSWSAVSWSFTSGRVCLIHYMIKNRLWPSYVDSGGLIKTELQLQFVFILYLCCTVRMISMHEIYCILLVESR